MDSKRKYSVLRQILRGGIIVGLGLSLNTAYGQTQTEFRWTGKGDGTSWNDAKNWAEGVVPTGSGSTWRPPAKIDVSGAEVTIQTKVPRFFGDINVGAPGKGCTLNMVTGGDLATQGGVFIGQTNNGTFNMSGGSLTIGVWGARDLRIGNGVMNFGSSASDKAPVIKVVDASRGFQVGANKGDIAEVNLNGYGTISTVQQAVFSLYGQSTVNVTGGNLILIFDTKATGLSRIGGGVRSYKSVINYKLDSTGASTMNFGGNVEFGVSEFNVSLGDGFKAAAGDRFTIISTSGDFTGTKAFGNVANGTILTAGDYKFTAAYTYDASGKDTFVLTVAE